MNQTQQQPINLNTITLPKETVSRLFVLSSQLSDYTEDILESIGDYSEEFISGLNQSLKEEHEGNVRHINSLADLS